MILKVINKGFYHYKLVLFLSFVIIMLDSQTLLTIILIVLLASQTFTYSGELFHISAKLNTLETSLLQIQVLQDQIIRDDVAYSCRTNLMLRSNTEV